MASEKAFSTESDTMKTKEYVFQSEINELMNLIINTLYTNKAVFLRELISNSSDAIDKDRHILMSEGNNTKKEYKIQVIPNKSERTITIRDNGIGMNEEDLINNLGTIARSGTKNFIESIKDATKTGNLIGQFGVGFYSAFLVSDKVEVYTRKDKKKYKWSSEANGKFTIEDCGDCDSETGTDVILNIKEAEIEVLEENVLKFLLHKHSGFINYPIELAVIKEKSNGDNEEIKELVTEFEKMNNDTPIWHKSPAEVTKEEYNELYSSLTGDKQEPLVMKHFTIEGEVNFKCIIYIPKKAPVNLFDMNRDVLRNVKLFVKKVFVTDESFALSPEWMMFANCIVDCEDLPLNVSREFLQENKMTNLIRKNISKRVINMISEMNESDYNIFHNEFSKCLKLGIMNDKIDKTKLYKILKFNSSSKRSLISIDDYCENKKDDQEIIYYYCGTDIESMRLSSVVKEFNDNTIDVLLLDDTLDEYMIKGLQEYEYNEKKLKFQSIIAENTKYPWDKDEFKEKEEFVEFITAMKDFFGDNISKINQTNKSKNPLMITIPDEGFSGNLERIMKSQTLTTGNIESKRILEVNVEHIIIRQMLKQFNEEDNKILSNMTKNMLYLLYQTSLIYGGYIIDDPYKYCDEINSIISSGYTGTE